MKSIDSQELIGHVDVLMKGSETVAVLDFDHTLFGSNSTEEFLAAAKPSWLVYAILFFTRKILPRLSSAFRANRRAQDHAAVWLVMLTGPWNYLLWKMRAAAIFEKNGQHALARFFKEVPPSRVVILSFGFDVIIRPLLRNTGWQHNELICTRFFSSPGKLPKDKLTLLSSAGSALDIKRAVFVTDSLDDRDVLQVAKFPYLIHPTGAKFSAEDRHYIPLRYTFVAKFERRHAVDQIFFVDLMVAALSTFQLAGLGFSYFGALILLFLSIFTVYEIGYFENDTVATKFEAAPRLREGANRFFDIPLTVVAWPWALTFGLGGCILALKAQGDGGMPAIDQIFPAFLGWLAVLVFLRVVYYFYNRAKESKRIFIYSALQVGKTLGILTMFPVSFVGLALSLAQTFMMWVKYLTYRLGGKVGTTEFPKEHIRLTFFVLLMAGMALTVTPAAWQVHKFELLIVSAWCGWRVSRGAVKKQIKNMLGPAKRA